MKKNTKINNRIIRRMLLIVILISAVILAAYFFISYQDICSGANRSIQEYLKDADYYMYDKSGSTSFVYECYVGGNPEDYMLEYYDYEYGYVEEEYSLDSYEQELSDYYFSNKEKLPYGNIYHFYNGDTYCVFLPMDDPVWEDEYRIFNNETQDSLVYCDVSYWVESLFRTVLMVAVIIAAVILLLFFVSRYTIRMLDIKDAGMKNFFANASHELKTPLMSIRGNVDGIRSGYVNVTDGCDTIEREVDRMSGLVGEILDIARLDSGAAQPEMLECDVREILYDAASSVLPEARNKGIELKLDLPDPVFRTCDEAMLYSAFSNMLTNGIRYADSYICVRTEDKNGKCQIVFENDGIPISDEDIHHVFDRFYKGNKGQSGIGMALAQEYIRLHGSEIRAGVENGHTVFKLLL